MHAHRILLVEPRGFCAGVEMAIKALALMVLRFGSPVYCVHDIVHNDRVVARFRRLGVHFVDRVEQLPPGVPALLSAHGTAPAAVAAAAARAPVLAQTTLAVDEWTAVVGAARRRFGRVWTARREDICYATSNRQAALRDVAGAVDAVIVVGSASSANTAALVQVAQRAGASCVLRVDGAGDLPDAGIVATVAVTAGASAPEDAVREVVQALRPAVVERAAPTHERTHFPLPAALRQLLADDDDGAALLALERELSAADLLARVEATITARAA